MQSVNERLYDLGVGHQVGLSRLATATLRDVHELLAELVDDVADRVLRAGTEVSRTRLTALLAALKKLYAESYSDVRKRVLDAVAEVAKYEAEYQQRTILGALPIDVGFALPSASQLVAAATQRPLDGHLLKDWSKRLGDGAYRRVAGALRTGAAEGATTAEIVRRIRGTPSLNYRDGLAAISRRGAESLVRTATNHAATAARELTYEANDDLIKGVRWTSTLDSRTTPICRSRDGEIYPPGEGPRPPAHWGCRSTTVPVLKSWRDLGIDVDEADPGTRASVNGQVPATETYSTWLTRQSAETQDEVLGSTRGKLLRSGGLKVEKFTDLVGRQYTLAELKSREAAAFRRAGLRV